jgi:hypothetical protein
MPYGARHTGVIPETLGRGFDLLGVPQQATETYFPCHPTVAGRFHLTTTARPGLFLPLRHPG